MVENERKKSVKIIDVVIGIFIIIIGFLIIIFSISLGDYLNLGKGYTPGWLEILTLIIFISGITTIIYGIKKILHK